MWSTDIFWDYIIIYLKKKQTSRFVAINVIL